MPTIDYVHPDGKVERVDAEAGISVMRAAILEGVEGIVGECGGQAMCATCHVFIEESDRGLPEIGEDEEEMLECTSEPRLESSRLGCQIQAGRDFDAITVRLPETQV